MHTPPVYIVLASCNGAKYISQQIDSLLAQSWPCLIYIFDDASTDNTINIIRDNYLEFENIVLNINRTQLGFVKNFEQGIKKVCALGAQYIALSDQDDIWGPQKIAKMMPHLLTQQSDNPTLAYCDLRMINEEGSTTHQSYLKFRNYAPRSPKSAHQLATALGQNGVMGNTILMNRSLATKALPFPNNLHSHDYWISLIAQLYGQCIFIPEPLVKYRIHRNNTSNSSSKLNTKKRISFKPILDRYIQRDFMLPYKEDSRINPILYILENKQPIPSHIEAISEHDRLLLVGFLHYLKFDRSRLWLIYWMLKHRFIRKSWKHRFRFIFRMLVTSRYPLGKNPKTSQQ